MSFMFEVYYKAPPDSTKENLLSEEVENLGGHLDYREGPSELGPENIVLTYEFNDWAAAQRAAEKLRGLGEHVEGPMDYGPSST